MGKRRPVIPVLASSIVFLCIGVGSGEEKPDSPNAPCETELAQRPGYSAIVLPTDKSALKKKGEDYDLTDVAGGVVFDLDADGVPEYTSWTAAKSNVGFLAYDRNGNGRIDDGKELFGNFTHAGRNNGFAALLQDAGRVGMVEEGHSLYDKLLLWTDRNHNGLSEPDELEPFSVLYSSIGMSYERSNIVDKHGNRFLFLGNAVMRTAPGRNFQRTPEENMARLVDVYNVVFSVPQ